MHTEPIPDQHPPLLRSLGTAGAVAGATSAHAGVAATLGLACRPRRRLADSRVGPCVRGNSRARVPLLSSFLELVERRPPRLCFGKRFQSRLEPGSSRSGGLRKAARAETRL